MEKIYSQSLDDSSIRMISFEFNNNIDGSKEIFSFNQQEIANLNMTQIIDAEHKTTFVIAFNILN